MNHVIKSGTSFGNNRYITRVRKMERGELMVELVIFAVVMVALIICYVVDRRKRHKKSTDDGTGKEPENKDDSAMIPDGENTTDSKDNKETVNKMFPVYWYENGEKEEGVAKMSAQGLQVFDQNGNLYLDVTDRVAKAIGIHNITTESGSLTITDGKPWFCMINTPAGYDNWGHGNYTEYSPRVWISDDKICWEKCKDGGSFYYGKY